MTPTHVNLHHLAALLRKRGLKVVIVDGAQGRAARGYPGGYTRGVQLSVLHHTASSGAVPSADVRFLINGLGEGFVIANAYLARNGTIYLIASGPTYTEGSGGPVGIVPVNAGNLVAFSLEVANRGDNSQTYTADQARSINVWNATVSPLLAATWDWPDDPFGPTRLITHFEWSNPENPYGPTRKIDLFGPVEGRPSWSTGGKWTMSEVRSSARRLAASWEAAVPPISSRHDMEPDMEFFWSDPDYPAVYLISGGSAMRVTPAAFRTFHRAVPDGVDGLLHIVERDVVDGERMFLAWCEERSGVSRGDKLPPGRKTPGVYQPTPVDD